jgi:hypothetical protein
MSIRVATTLLSIVIASCASIPKKSPTINAAIADDFLVSVCASTEDAHRFADDWLKHEKSNWNYYASIYYTDATFTNERSEIAKRYSGLKSEVCKYTRAFLETAPDVINRASVRVEQLMGVRPSLPIYFAVALQETDGRGDSYNGRDILALNARHDSFQRLTGLQVTIAHELIHATQTEIQGETQLNPIVRALYREGGAVFGVQQLYPEIGEGAWGLKMEDRELARKMIPQGAAELLAEIESSSPSTSLLRKFFQGGVRESGYPPKMGYVVGSEIYARLAKTMGAQKAVRISPQEFRSKALDILNELKSGHSPSKARE